jgi:hypothetical protein
LTELSRRPPAVMVQVDADVFSLHRASLVVRRM